MFCVYFEHRDSAVPYWKFDDFTSSCIFEDNGTYEIMLKIDELVVATERFAWNLSVKRTKISFFIVKINRQHAL